MSFREEGNVTRFPNSIVKREETSLAYEFVTVLTPKDDVGKACEARANRGKQWISTLSLVNVNFVVGISSQLGYTSAMWAL